MSRELNWALHEGKFRVVSLIGSWPAAFMVITGGCWVWDRMLLEVDVIRKFVLITGDDDGFDMVKQKIRMKQGK